MDIYGLCSLLSAIGRFDFRADISYVDHLEQPATARSVPVDLVDTFGNPADLRGRATITWSHGNLSATGAVNYVDGYEDLVSSPARPIGSWTTLDLRLAYLVPASGFSGLFKGASVSLAISNLFDRDPPFVNNPIGIAYDPSNADPLGRFITVHLSASF